MQLVMATTMMMKSILISYYDVTVYLSGITIGWAPGGQNGKAFRLYSRGSSLIHVGKERMCRMSGAVVHNCVIKGPGMASSVSATRHIKDPVPRVEKSRASCPGGRFPPSFIHRKSSSPD